MSKQDSLKAAKAEANRQASRVFLWCLICLLVGHAAGLLRGWGLLSTGQDWLVVTLIMLVAVIANLVVRYEVMLEHKKKNEWRLDDD